MKHFVETVFSMKVNASLCFTVIMIVYALVELIWKVPLLSAARVLQLLLLSMVCGVLQCVFFSGLVIKKMSYFHRTLCFAPSILVVIAVFCVLFRWFPVNELAAWGIFLGVFIAVFLLLMLGFEVMFRITGQRYTDLLGQKQGQK